MAISNKINQSSSSKKRRFNIKYIFAEIFLITAGILIALAIDNWNTDRAEQKMINKYLIEMYKEYNNEIKRLQESKNNLMLSTERNARALNIIKNSQYDSIPILEELLIGIGNPVNVENQFPITKEFLDQNLLYKIKNEKIKNQIKNFSFYLGFNNKINEFETNQYINTIEPFIKDNINYSKICCPNLKPFMIQGGLKTNFKSLMKNMELWNILSFKREWLLLNSGVIDYTIYFLETIIEEIDNELVEEIKLAEMSDTGRLGISAIKEVEGFKITIIESGGPAFKAGLKKGDLIIMVTQPDADPVDISEMDFFDAMKLIVGPIGTTVVLTVKRTDGTIEDVSVVRDVVK